MTTEIKRSLLSKKSSLLKKVKAHFFRSGQKGKNVCEKTSERAI